MIRVRSDHVASLVVRLGPRKRKSLSTACSASQRTVGACRPVLAAADFANYWTQGQRQHRHCRNGECFPRKEAYLYTLGKLALVAEP